MEKELALYRAAELLKKVFPGETEERLIKMLLVHAKQLILNGSMDQRQQDENVDMFNVIESSKREIFNG